MAYNILMIAPTSFFGDYGCHVRILEEVRVLQKRGHRVTIVTYYKGRDLPELNIVRTRPTPWHADYEVGSSRHKVAFDALLSWTALRTARRLKPDIIHAHLHEGALIGRVVSALTGAPLVFDYQGSLTAEMLDHHFVRPGGKREWFFRTLENRIDRMPRAILTSSRHSAQSAARPNCRIRRSAWCRMPDCVDTDFFRPRTPADQADVDAIERSTGHSARSDGGDLPRIAGAVSGHVPHHSRGAPGRWRAQTQRAFPGDGLSQSRSFPAPRRRSTARSIT